MQYFAVFLFFALATAAPCSDTSAFIACLSGLTQSSDLSEYYQGYCDCVESSFPSDCEVTYGTAGFCRQSADCVDRIIGCAPDAVPCFQNFANGGTSNPGSIWFQICECYTNFLDCIGSDTCELSTFVGISNSDLCSSAGSMIEQYFHTRASDLRNWFSTTYQNWSVDFSSTWSSGKNTLTFTDSNGEGLAKAENLCKALASKINAYLDADCGSETICKDAVYICSGVKVISSKRQTTTYSASLEYEGAPDAAGSLVVSLAVVLSAVVAMLAF